MSTPENHHVFTAPELAIKDRYDAALEKIAEVAAQRDALKEANASVSRQLAAVTKERDALKTTLASADREIERLNLMVEMMDESKELAASQQEVARLRDALMRVSNATVMKSRDSGMCVGAEVKDIASDALSATPAPVRTSAYKLKAKPNSDTKIGLFSSWLNEDEDALHRAIDAEIERTGRGDV